jgi:hypothetical protein
MYILTRDKASNHGSSTKIQKRKISSSQSRNNNIINAISGLWLLGFWTATATIPNTTAATTKLLPTINLQLICRYDIRPIDLEEIFGSIYRTFLTLPEEGCNVSLRVFDKLDGMEAIHYPSTFCNMTSNRTMLTAKAEAAISAKESSMLTRIDLSQLTRGRLKMFFDANVCNETLLWQSRIILSQNEYTDRNAYRHDLNMLCAVDTLYNEEEAPQVPMVFGLLVGAIMFGMFMNELSLLGSVQQRHRRREGLRQYESVQIELPSFQNGPAINNNQEDAFDYGDSSSDEDSVVDNGSSRQR